CRRQPPWPGSPTRGCPYSRCRPLPAARPPEVHPPRPWSQPLPPSPLRPCFSSPRPPMPMQAEAEGKSGHGRGIFFWGNATVLPRSVEVTSLLRAWSGGDPAALDQLADQVYNELRRIARRYMRNERTGNTLETTALVNEVYLRLVDVKNVDWQQ